MKKGGETHAIGPRAYLEDSPSHQSVRLGGRYINLKRLAEEQDLDPSYVTRIISGERPNPSLSYLQKIADALGMTIDNLLTAIRERQEQRATERARRLSS